MDTRRGFWMASDGASWLEVVKAETGVPPVMMSLPLGFRRSRGKKMSKSMGASTSSDMLRPKALRLRFALSMAAALYLVFAFCC